MLNPIHWNGHCPAWFHCSSLTQFPLQPLYQFSCIFWRHNSAMFICTVFRDVSPQHNPSDIPYVISRNHNFEGPTWSSALLAALINLLNNQERRKKLLSFYLWSSQPRDLTRRSHRASEGWSWDLKPAFCPPEFWQIKLERPWLHFHCTTEKEFLPTLC